MKLSIPQLILLPVLAYSGYFFAGEEPVSTWIEQYLPTTERAISQPPQAERSEQKKQTPIATKPKAQNVKPAAEKEKVIVETPTPTPFTRYSDFILTPAFLSDSLKGSTPFSSYKGPHLTQQTLQKGVAAKRANQAHLSIPDAAGTIALRYYNATPRGEAVSWNFWTPSATNYRIFINLKNPSESFDGTIKHNSKKIKVADGKFSASLIVEKPNKHQLLIAAAKGFDTNNIQAVYLVPENNLSNYETERNHNLTSPDLSKIPKKMVKKMEEVASAGYDIHTTVPQQMKEGKNGYLIITTEAKRAALTNLYAFIHHKEYRGFNVTVVTEKDYGGGTGSKAARNIRKWLQQNYKTKNALYALMLGDPNPSNGDVPYKNCGAAAEDDGDDSFGKSKEQLEGNFPTDYFYTDLDCDWDISRNGFYGDDEDFAEGGINGQPEIFVGRIPFYGINAAKGNVKDVDQILERIIRYENQAVGMASRHNLFYTGYDENRLSKLYDGFFKHNGAKLTLHSRDHTAPFIADIKRPTVKDTLDTLKSNTFGFVFYQAEDPEDTFLSSDDIAKLSPKSASVYSIKGIGAAEPRNPDNIAFGLLRNSAIAVYAPTKGIDGYEKFDEFQHAAYYSRLHFGMSTGEALWTTLGDLTRDRGISEEHYLATLLGDPSVVPMPQTSGPILSVSPGFDIRIDASEDREMDYEIRNNGTKEESYTIKAVADLSLSESEFTLEPGEVRIVTASLKKGTPLKKGTNKFTLHVNSSIHKKQRHLIIIK